MKKIRQAGQGEETQRPPGEDEAEPTGKFVRRLIAGWQPMQLALLSALVVILVLWLVVSGAGGFHGWVAISRAIGIVVAVFIACWLLFGTKRVQAWIEGKQSRRH